MADIGELAKSRMESVDKVLDEYELSVGLPTYQESKNVEEMDEYLNMGRQELEALTQEACEEIACRLIQFAFHMQRAQNRETSRASWARNELEMTIAGELNNYEGYGYKEKAPQAIKGNAYASKVNKIMIYAEQREKRLAFLSRSLNSLADVLKNSKRNKWRENAN